MLRFKDLSLSLQLPLIAASCALATGLCVLWLAAKSSAYLEVEREKLYGESLAQQIAVSVSDALQRGDLLSARASLQRFIESSLASAVEVRDIEDMPIGAAGTTKNAAGRQYEAPIRAGSDIAGHVRVTLNDELGRESRWRFLFSLLALVAALSLLVFIACRALSQGLTARLLYVQSQLQLENPNEGMQSENEITALRHCVERLPLDMLRGHAGAPAAAKEFSEGSIVFVHLTSLVRYVSTLSESNLHRYSRRLQQIVQAAAQCYRGELSVTRPFGLLITFSPQPNAGSEALRAASCARLIVLIADGIAARTGLSLDLGVALGPCEQGAQDVDDIYPQLHLHGAIDELRDTCLQQTEAHQVQLAAALLEDPHLAAAAVVEAPGDGDSEFPALMSLAPEQEKLLAHQAGIIIERIKPAKRD